MLPEHFRSSAVWLGRLPGLPHYRLRIPFLGCFLSLVFLLSSLYSFVAVIFSFALLTLWIMPRGKNSLYYCLGGFGKGVEMSVCVLSTSLTWTLFLSVMLLSLFTCAWNMGITCLFTQNVFIDHLLKTYYVSDVILGIWVLNANKKQNKTTIFGLKLFRIQLVRKVGE